MNFLRVFGLNASKEYAIKVADFLDAPLSPHVERNFDDGEPYIRSEVNVRGYDVFVIQSLYADERESVADKFMKLLFFINSLRDASARRITAVIPYFAYQRQDRKIISREGIYTKYTAQLMESVGVDRVLTMDVHNLAAFQCSFRIPTDHLECRNLFVQYFLENLKDPANLTILSPDSGGIGRVRNLRNKLSHELGVEIETASVDKTHEGNFIKANKVIGNIEGRRVIIYDDMFSSFKSVIEACSAVKEAGGEVEAAVATHGLFVGNAVENLSNFEKPVIVSDTIPLRFGDRLQVVETTQFFAKAIRRIHEEEGGSISELLK